MAMDIIGFGNITITDLNDASISINPPRNPDVGDIWIDSSGDKNILKQYNGTKWEPASLDVTELDKDLSDKIIAIENTLGNIGDDGVLTYDDRKILVEELNLIVGETLSTSNVNKYPTALPDYVTVDSNASGSFSNYRLAAQEVGIRGSNEHYVNLQEAYTALVGFMGRQGTPRPWDIRSSTKTQVTTLTNSDEFREVILNYYLAELALVTETGERAQDIMVSDVISEDSGVTPFLVMPTQEGGSLRVEVQGFYKSEPEPHPDGYALEFRTQRAEKTSDGYVGVGDKKHVLVPLPKTILEGESLLQGEDGVWKIVTPLEEIVLSKKAQRALNNIPSFRKATILTAADTHNTELEILVGVKSLSASWYREQQAKDYTDDAMNNTGSALDVENTGPYEIPVMPVARVSEYTLEAFIYWRGGDNSSILARENPLLQWKIDGQEYIEEVEVDGEIKQRDPETRGYLGFSPSVSYNISTRNKISENFIPVNSWTGVTVTYDGVRTKLFIGGELVANESSGRPLELDDLLLGGLAEKDWFDGYITNFRVWDKALPDADVKRYQNRRLGGDEPGLILYYRLNGGNKIFDSGPHENHIEPEENIGWVEDKTIIQDLEREIEYVSTQVTQLADSWVLNIHSNDDLVTAINASTEGVRIKGKSIQLDGDTIINGRLTINANHLSEELEKDINEKATKKELEDIELTPGPKGEDAYTVILSNESHTFEGGTSGPIAGRATQVDVIAYKGASPVSATVGTLSGDVAGITAIKSGSSITFTTTSSTKTSGIINIPITVNGVKFTRTFSYAIALRGADGNTGSAGRDGKDGTDGRGIITTTVEYKNHTNGENAPTGAWSAKSPGPKEGQYLWTRTTITYTEGTPSVSYSTSYTPLEGDGVTGSTVTYALGDNGSSTPTGWQATVPPLTKGKYLWTRTVTTYKKRTPVTTYSISYISKDGERGATGSSGKDGTDAQIIKLTPSAQIFSKSKGSNSYTPSTITVTASRQNISGGAWTYSVNGGAFTATAPTYVSRSGDTVTINQSGLTSSVRTLAIKLRSGTTEDVTTIGVVEDGDKGDRGPTGIQGPPGANGQSQYTHIRYSANANGSGMTASPLSTTKYIGIAVTSSSEAPGYTGFTWSKYAGEDGSPGARGPQGVPGTKGTDGTTTYTWIKYADDDKGAGMNDYPDGKKYIGMAFNKTTPTESTTARDYTWSLMPQNIEVGGRNLLKDSRDEKTTNRFMSIPVRDIFEEHIGRKVSVSFDLKINSGGIVRVLSMYPYQSNGITIKDSRGIAPSKIDTWERFTLLTEIVQAGNNPNYTPGDIAFYDAAGVNDYSIRKIKIEFGNTATDWTPAPEDIEDEISQKADDSLVRDIDMRVTETESMTEHHSDELGTLATTIQDYREMLENNTVDAKTALEEIGSLLSRETLIQENLGEFAKEMNFINTQIKYADEGIMIQHVNKNTGGSGTTSIRISNNSIDFMDGNKRVAYITGQVLYINHGIFVESAKIGEHYIETVDGQTIFTWMG